MLFKENHRIMFIFFIFLCSSILKIVDSQENVVSQVNQTEKFNVSFKNSTPNYEKITENGINLSNNKTFFSNNKLVTRIRKEINIITNNQYKENVTVFNKSPQKISEKKSNNTMNVSELPKINGNVDISGEYGVLNTFSVETSNLVNSTINASNHHIPSNRTFMESLGNPNKREAKTANKTIVQLEDRAAFTGNKCVTARVKVLGVCTEPDIDNTN